jgi:hypothetical protein
MIKELKNAFGAMSENLTFQLIGVIILLFPMIATTGQFVHSGYYLKVIPLLLLYWPGTSVNFSVQTPVWLISILFFIIYLAGIAWLLRRQNLGKVIVFTILIFVVASIFRTGLSTLFGMTEKGLPNVAGKANSVIFSLWHNPIWEEIVFRGIPLLILLAVEKYWTKKRTLTGVLIYCIVPSVACGIYHIPGHGLIRFFDTLIIGVGFSLLTLHYTFFAPVVMHDIADAMLVMNIHKIESIQPSEVEWIIQYGRTLNTFSSLLLLLLIILIPALILYYYRKAGIAAKINI